MSILQDLLALNVPVDVALNAARGQIDEAETMSTDEAEHAHDELQDLHNKMVQLMEEVRHAVKMLPRSLRGSAEAYWIPHIMVALGGEHEWMTAGHESTMQKTIDELKEEFTERDSDDADDRDPGDHEYR